MVKERYITKVNIVKDFSADFFKYTYSDVWNHKMTQVERNDQNEHDEHGVQHHLPIQVTRPEKKKKTLY